MTILCVLSSLKNFASVAILSFGRHLSPGNTIQHDLLPGLASGRPEQDQHGHGEGLEVVVPVDIRVLINGDPPHHLHSHCAVDEEDQSDQEHDPGKGFERFHKCPQKCSDVFILVE